MYNTIIEPRTLTDRELVRFAEELAHNGELPVSMQLELIKRLSQHVV
jgi:hypothetical protein